MNKNKLILTTAITVGFFMMFIFPELAFAQSAFESKVTGLTSGLLNVVLPAISVIGLIYAAIMAASGDAGAKGRMILVIGASVVGFLAPVIIEWFKSSVGG